MGVLRVFPFGSRPWGSAFGFAFSFLSLLLLRYWKVSFLGLMRSAARGLGGVRGDGDLLKASKISMVMLVNLGCTNRLGV